MGCTCGTEKKTPTKKNEGIENYKVKEKSDEDERKNAFYMIN